MGSLVNRAQFNTVREGLAQLQAVAQTLFDDSKALPVDADANVACCLGPMLLGLPTPEAVAATALVHDVEVFGPVATLLPYKALPDAVQNIARGQGSLVASVYGDDAKALADTAKTLAPLHGRVHVISPAAAAAQTGHGNVMPQSLHGGPGRAGGGEELGGLRALNFYHRRSAVQAHPDVLSAL
jgi:3,4-dehydroadipyl-CoA semialdehyde dehydrogenase